MRIFEYSKGIIVLDSVNGLTELGPDVPVYSNLWEVTTNYTRYYLDKADGLRLKAELKRYADFSMKNA